jgi:hypothetical protein
MGDWYAKVHVAFEHATTDDLLNANLRLKQLGIEPI